jgi:hypothetical protein
MQTITSKVIGELTQNDNFDDWWNGSNIPVPFFDNAALGVTIMHYTPAEDENFMQQADEALTNFLQLGTADRLAISSYVFENFEDFKNDVGDDYFSEELQQLEDEQGIWKFVRPNEINISRRHRRDKDIYIAITLSADWEEEHGLQLVFRQGKKLTRISSIDGHITDADAYDTPDEEDKLLSAF